MKILQINAVNGVKSTGRICTEIADYINENGNECYIAYSEGVKYKKGYKIGTPLGNKIHGICSRIFGRQAYFSINDTQKLLGYIENIKPDVIHLHNLHANYINLKILLNYLAKKDIPTVLTLHDCWFFTGKCTHYTVDKCYKWQFNCGNCPRLKKDNPSWILDCTRIMYNDKKIWFKNIPRLAVIGVSDWITNEAKKSLLSSAKIITRIYNWIDLDIFKPIDTKAIRHKMNLENKFIILGVASSWSKEKGIFKFIELSKLISDDTVIILVGSMDVKISLPENIIHIKETNNVKELVEYYSMANVFLNPSLEESFGKVTAESLACGTPVVVLNSTANPELVGYGCGDIVQKSNIQDIHNAILNIKNNDELYSSDKCIEYAKNNFNKEHRLSDYIKLYEEILKEL